MNLAALLVCVAGLMHGPAPLLPEVLWLPHHSIKSATRTFTWASYRPGRIELPSDGGIYTFGLAAHELAHLVQHAEGRPYWTPEAEAEAEWVQRKAPVWCRQR